MTQQLVPIDGGVQKVETALTDFGRLLVLSQQYIITKHLENRPTEWVPGGRPVYRRLPATSETYQIDFFNIVPAPNTAVSVEVDRIGYVYVPWGQGLNSANSLYVSSSQSKKDLLIKGGVIVWEYGSATVLPTIINLPLIGAERSQYELAYQLIYDDSPIAKLYKVEDFSLRGLPLSITASTDNTIGWRYPSVNAFLNTTTKFWANKDTYFPSSAQPTQSYLQWESDLSQAYSSFTMRCPTNTAYTGTATLSYYDGTNYSFVETVNIQKDSVSQYFRFETNPVFQTGWKVEFSSLDVSVQSIVVTGVLTLLEQQAALSTRSVLVMYPTGTLPRFVTNAQGNKVPAVYCPLAIVDVGVDSEIELIDDQRYIIHRDYMPIADWLTLPFDEDLISLYEQVENYPTLWLAPPTCLKQEYLTLEEYQITVEV